jgi:hypothetical protein
MSDIQIQDVRHLAEHKTAPHLVKISYRQTASDDLTRQFRYYLLAGDLPEVAVRLSCMRSDLQSCLLGMTMILCIGQTGVRDDC